MSDKYIRAAEIASEVCNIIPKFNISPSSGFRSRCEFGYKDNHYTMINNGKKVFLKSFDIAHPSINRLMPKLLKVVNTNKLLKHKLFQVNFRCNNKLNLMVSLIYHKEINSELFEQSTILSNSLNIQVILRSKKKYFSTSNNLLEEIIESKKPYSLFQTDQTFFQPNRFMVPRMVDLVSDMIEKPADLLELYCGCGTFTIALAQIFDNVFATENNRKSIECLDKAIEKNNLTNINYARLSCDEVMRAINGHIYTRLKGVNIQNYNFSHILVDPPRSGLTLDVIDLINNFDNVIYISCNIETFVRDIKLLNRFKISKLEFFDQFVNTPHIELVSYITKK